MGATVLDAEISIAAGSMSTRIVNAARPEASRFLVVKQRQQYTCAGDIAGRQALHVVGGAA